MNNIKRIRESLGLTKTEVADRVAVSRSFISQVENGKVNLSYELACALANAMTSDPILIAGEDVLKAGFKDENLFNLISVILDAKFKDVIVEGNETPENTVKYWILSYLFEYKLSADDLKEIFNFIKYKVKVADAVKVLRHFDNLDTVIEEHK